MRRQDQRAARGHDREIAPRFLREVWRVLKPGGIQRIVVPDFEGLCRAYLAHVALCDQDARQGETHDALIGKIIEQCVRRWGYGTERQPPLRRWIEKVLLGEARRRGETHQWMYDRINLSALLTSLGYRDLCPQRYDTSLVPDWNGFGLDLNDQGQEYKPGSLYLEARK